MTSIDPILVPILRGNYTFQGDENDHLKKKSIQQFIHIQFLISGTRKLISVGEKLVDYNSDFQLYLICRDSKPNIPSFIKTLLTCVNFEITYSGLSQQVDIFYFLIFNHSICIICFSFLKAPKVCLVG